ncbi:MAG: flagellar basal-body rod protein FlgG [Synergistaceae bacterium]|nr:flagellar basal-body rod protein FlgG [Synergistaceae bacterium]
MLRSLWTSASGMIAQQTNLDVTTNNLANVNTTGFKRKRADFADLLYQINREPGAPVEPESMVPTGVQVGLGTRVVGTSRYMNQGNLQVTDQPLDLAIEGDGFYQVVLPNGQIAYTRASKWAVDSEGQVLNVDGLLMEPAITIPEDATEIMVSPEGLVSVKIAGQDEAEEVGQIELVRFVNPGGLRAMGKNLFLESPCSGAPIVGFPGDEGLGQVHQGILEMSNVQVVDEMVAMIIAQRAYEANSKGVQTADELLRIANGLKR